MLRLILMCLAYYGLLCLVDAGHPYWAVFLATFYDDLSAGLKSFGKDWDAA